MRHAFLLTLRIFLAIPGGYLLSAGSVALAAVLLSHLMPRSDAFALSAMSGFVLNLVVLIWAFSDRSLLRVLVVISAGAPGTFTLATILGA